MEKRMAIAIGVSLLILFIFQTLSPRQEGIEEYVDPGKKGLVPGAEQTLQQTGAEPRYPVVERKEQIQTPIKEEFTTLRTPELSLTFSNMGAGIKQIDILANKDTTSEKETLYEQSVPEKRTFFIRSTEQHGRHGARGYRKIEKEGSVEYTRIEDGWLEIRKIYSTGSNKNVLNAQILLTNTSNHPREISMTLIGPGNIKQHGGVMGRNFLEANTLLDGDLWRMRRVRRTEERKGKVDWTAVKNRYYAIAVNPVEPAGGVIVKEEETDIMTEIKEPRRTIQPGGQLKKEYLLYAGPLDEKRISDIDPSMTLLVNFGFFGGVSKVLLLILRFLHRITNNWGVSIILLTVLINVVLFPLAVKSFVSMHKMKKIQPHIMKLKELHKDNPQKLNKETMELYKNNNVNPLGGCLPLLLQMPIFIALYQGLVRSIELKGASFLWIRDLAQPEAIPLPFSLPLIGDSINILPLLMVGMMAVQQKITQAGKQDELTEEQRNQQKMMMLIMPVVFGFMFYNMPSGLVLYWLTNTILMTTGQKIISIRLEA